MTAINWLRIRADDSTIRGLVIRHSQHVGMRINRSRVLLEFNYIGVSPAGDQAMGNANEASGSRIPTRSASATSSSATT